MEYTNVVSQSVVGTYSNRMSNKYIQFSPRAFMWTNKFDPYRLGGEGKHSFILSYSVAKELSQRQSGSDALEVQFGCYQHTYSCPQIPSSRRKKGLVTLGKTVGPVDAPRSNLRIPIRSQLQECSRAIARYMNLNCLHSLTGQSDPSSIFKLTHVGVCAESRPNRENGPKSHDPFPSIWRWGLGMRLLSTWTWINECEGLGPYQVKPEHIYMYVYIYIWYVHSVP